MLLPSSQLPFPVEQENTAVGAVGTKRTERLRDQNEREKIVSKTHVSGVFGCPHLVSFVQISERAAHNYRVLRSWLGVRARVTKCEGKACGETSMAGMNAAAVATRKRDEATNEWRTCGLTTT